MTGLEALMWRLGRRDPSMVPWMRLRVDTERPLDSGVVAERLVEVTRRVPRLRELPVPPSMPMLTPRWESDPAFDLGNHFFGVSPEGPPPLDRPPWRAVHSGSALDLQLHHSYTDGLGGIHLLGELFDGPRPPVSPPSDSMPGPLEELVSRSAGAIARALSWSAAALADPSSVAELLPGGQPSPLLRARSGEACFASLSFPLTRLRGTGRRLGATVNDVFLAGLLEGLGRYHDKHLVTPPSAIRLGVPISTRPDGPLEEMSNQLYGALLAAPLGCVDFDERARLVHEMVRFARARRSPELPQLLDDLAGFASGWPGADLVAGAAMRRVDVLASNLAGPAEALSLCGAAVERLIPYGPRSGAALNATLLSYAGTAFIGLNVDPAAFAEPDVLVDCLRTALDDVLD
jgi:diacylglycerol O-acyltransferase